MANPIVILRQPKKRAKPNNSIAIVYPLVAAFLSGLICYQLGVFAGCASPWLADIQGAHQSSASVFEYYGSDDPDSPAYFTAAHSNNNSSRAKIFDPTDRRSVPRTNLPYDCGVVFFYHIPSTGGASINSWFKKYQNPILGNLTYYAYWEIETRKDGSFNPAPEEGEAKFAKGMSEHIQNLGPNEWRIAHSHLTSTYLNESEDLLYKWRSDVEAQGCQLINTVMFRDPLNHMMSLHKVITAKQSTRDEWTKYLSSPTGPGLWATMLDFFLYNNHALRYHEDYPNGPGGRNPYNVTKEVKVARALGLLHRHFDIVTVGDHATFMDTILNWTGWLPIKMPKTNVYQKELQFTKKEVEDMQKLLKKNGDTEFIDQVKQEYHDYLSYLGV
ncbi:hypothetical protein ACHAXR_009790 [Thalassiosira sp. AJA248-18]